MNILYLIDSERALFGAVPKGVQSGWKVEEEEIAYEDSKERMHVRLELMDIQDPRLKAFEEKAKGVKDEEKFLEMVQDIDLSQITNADISEIFYALGPTLLSQLIASLLSEAKGDEYIEQVAVLSTMRHLMFGTAVSAS